MEETHSTQSDPQNGQPHGPIYVLIPCSHKQKSYPAPAEQLYEGYFFKQALKVARLITTDRYIRILSTSRRVLELNQTINPYNDAPPKKVADKRQLCVDIRAQLDPYIQQGGLFIFLTPQYFYKDFVNTPPALNASCPLLGLGRGPQIQLINQALQNPNILANLQIPTHYII